MHGIQEAPQFCKSKSKNVPFYNASSSVVNELKLNDRKINSPEELAEAFNNYFINIGPSLAHEMAHSSVSFERFVKPSHSELPEFRTVTDANVQNS